MMIEHILSTSWSSSWCWAFPLGPRYFRLLHHTITRAPLARDQLHQSTSAPTLHIVHTSNNTSTHRTRQKCQNRKTLPFTLWLAHWTNCVFTKFPFLLNPAQCCTVWGRNEITLSVFMETLALHNAQTHSLQCSMHNFYKAQCTNTIRIAQCTIRNAQVHILKCNVHCTMRTAST